MKAFIAFCDLLFPVLILSCTHRPTPGTIVTVTGDVPASALGTTLPHEHITTDFIGAEKVEQPQYDRDSAAEVILPYLLELKKTGVQTMIECTPQYIGRDVVLLKMLSAASGIHIVTNTGYYAAAEKKFLPAHAYTESPGDLAARWLDEWHNGIRDTGIRPGFIKLGVGRQALDSVEEKLLLAAIEVHKSSGLVIAIHTGGDDAARSEYQVLHAAGLPGEAMILVHAQNTTQPVREELAHAGVWISLDGVSQTRLDDYVAFVMAMKQAALLRRVLLSHDDGWRVENMEGKIRLVPFDNGNSIPYLTLFDRLIDLLRRSGITAREIEMITRTNPAAAFAIRE